MQNTNEVLSREMSSDIVANPQLSRILDLENGLTADERQQLIYSYLSTSRPRNEMVLLLSARGDIKLENCKFFDSRGANYLTL